MLHFVTDMTRKEGNCTTHVIDGYTTRKTYLGAVHEIGKMVAKIDAGEGEILTSIKTETEAKQALLKNVGNDTYCFELEEVPCACEYDEETDETKYEDGHFYFMIRFFVYEDEEEAQEATEEPEIEEDEPETEINAFSSESNQEDKEEGQTTIRRGINPGDEVWTGYPGQYETAPEEPGTYRLVSYFHEDETGQRIHEYFEFIRE